MQMREAWARERGFAILAAICALLAAIAVWRAADAHDGGIIEVQDFKPPASALIDINTASELMLTSLPGVGEKLARSICEGRPYESVDDLLSVDGIGEKTLAGMRDRICVGEPGA